MKKLLLIAAFIVVSMTSFAQTGAKSVLVKAGYQSDFERLGLGVEGRYNLTENIRLAPDVTFFFPNNHMTGLDINLNAHYVLPIQDGLSLYPLVGLAALNNRWSDAGLSQSSTDLGFNLGAGGSYDLNEKGFLNVDVKYTFSDVNFAAIMIGYGVKF